MFKERSSLVFGGIIGAVLVSICICGVLGWSGFMLLMGSDSSTSQGSPTPARMAAPTQTQTHTLEVLNLSGSAICYLYMSPATEDSWGPDQLGSDVIDQGRRFTLYSINPGVYDLRAETCGGQIVRRYGIRVYRDLEWTLYDD